MIRQTIDHSGGRRMSIGSPGWKWVPLAAAAALSALVGTAQAQGTWPSRPVTIVVPFGPGASNDTFTRAIAQVLSKKFGQPFVVDNRPGAGGFTGASQVVRAAPDGYTFLELPNSIASFKQVMKVDLDPEKDLVTIATFAKSPSALVVPASLPVKTVAEFVDYAKKNQDKVFYGFTGIGATQHVAASLFLTSTGLKLKGINYKSSAEAQTDLVAGRLQMMFVTVASALGQIEGGQLRLLGYTADTSPPSAPKAPTLAEGGVKGMDAAQVWWALFAPKNLPADIAKKMNDAVNEALKDPTVIDLMAKSGASPTTSTLESAAKDVKTEVGTIAKMIKDGDIKVE
jgi:tripartite-type tricarboxylate transporter receptor subunit TctC